MLRKDIKISFRLSQRGVPFILISFERIPDIEFPGRCITLSMCWFGKTRCYRFWDYNTQEKLIDFFLKPGEEMSLDRMLEIIQGEVDKTKKS
jgi:hypothetical protein